MAGKQLVSQQESEHLVIKHQGQERWVKETGDLPSVTTYCTIQAHSQKREARINAIYTSL